MVFGRRLRDKVKQREKEKVEATALVSKEEEQEEKPDEKSLAASKLISDTASEIVAKISSEILGEAQEKEEPKRRGLNKPMLKISKTTFDRKKSAQQEEPVQAQGRLSRRFISKYVPPRGCTDCAIGKKCPMFRPGAKCAFTNVVEQHKIHDYDDVIEAGKALVELMLQRIQFAVLAEQLSGDVMKDELNKAIQTTSFLMRDLSNVVNNSQRNTVQSAGISGNEVTNNVLAIIFGKDGGEGLENLTKGVQELRRPQIAPSDDDPCHVEYEEIIRKEEERGTAFIPE